MRQQPASTNQAAHKDDMLDYQCAVLEYGMLLLNFRDAISEGDGGRIIRCWKFFLLYMKNDGSKSRKYALEGLYLICQTNAILSARAAYHLTWNRFFKSKHGAGGNIPLDLALEHFNRFLKTIAKNIGHTAANKKSLARYCKALPVTKHTIENWDKESLFIRRSGKHIRQSYVKDLKKIVAELLKQNAMKKTPGRKYRHFAQCPSSLLEGFDLHSMFVWVNQHKKKINMEKTAR